MRLLPALSFRETMRGSFWLLDEPTDERAMRISLEARADNFAEFLHQKTWSIQGTIEAEQLATGSALKGTVRANPIEERRLTYRLAFRGNDGDPYELTGYRTWSGWAPLESLTLLPASLYDRDGEELARAALRFDLRADCVGLIKSIRFAFR
jgi:hypothetical protein